MDYDTGKMLEAVHAKLDYLIASLCPPKTDEKQPKKDEEE